MKNWILALVIASSVFAEGEDPDLQPATPAPTAAAAPTYQSPPQPLTAYQLHTGMIWHIYPSINVGSLTNIASNSAVSVGGGFGTDMMITSAVGIFGDLQYTRRSIVQGGISTAAGFLDFAFGINLNIGTRLLNLSNSRSVIRAGAFAAIPLNRFFTGNLIVRTFSTATNTYLGFYADAPFTWSVSPGAAIGVAPYFKAGAGTVVKEPTINIRSIDFGLNVVLEFI